MRSLELKMAIDTYLDNRAFNYAARSRSKTILCDSLANIVLNDFTWNWMMNRNSISEKVQLIKFAIFLAESNIFVIEGILECKECLSRIIPQNLLLLRGEPRDLSNTTPYSFFLVGKRKHLVIIKRINKVFHDIFNQFCLEYLNNVQINSGILTLQHVFEGLSISSIDDFNDDTYELHMKMGYEYSCLGNRHHAKQNLYYTSLISQFYMFVQRKNIIRKSSLFKKYNSEESVFCQYLPKYLYEGYTFVNFDKYEECPKEDKLIIRSCDQHGHEGRNIGSIDFTRIKNEELRRLVKLSFWQENNKIRCIKDYLCLFDFTDLVCERIKDKTEFKIETEDIISYRNSLLNKGKKISRRFLVIRNFLRFLNAIKYQKTNPLHFALLREDYGKAKNIPIAFKNEEIKLIINAYQKEYENEKDLELKKRCLLEYYLLLLIEKTEIRKSDLLGLNVDCLRKTLSFNGRDEYKILAKTKTSKGEFQEYNVTFQVKEIIEKCIEITQEDREKCPTVYKNLLFICQRRSFKTIMPLSHSTIREHFKTVIKNLKIDYKPMSAIRKFYHTKASEFIKEHKYTWRDLEAITGHRNDIHERFYVDSTEEIHEICKLYFKTDVGDLDVVGSIKRTNEFVFDESKTVENKCGQCSKDYCDLNGNLDCLLCKNFVTTPDHIPFFIKEIEKIDKEILDQTIRHEKEFLVSIKKLLVSYVRKILQFEGEKEYGN